MNSSTATTLHSLPRGFRAVVMGASGGIGSAICNHLKADPHVGDLVELSRGHNGLDLLDEPTIAAAAEKLSQTKLHLLVCATGILTVADHAPEKSLREIDPDIMLHQFRTNAIGPALVAKHFLPLFDKRDRSIALFLSARIGSIGDNRLGGWISYRSSKAALNQIVRTTSIELSRTHPQAVIAAVHPGTVRTRLSNPYSATHPTVSPEQAASSILHSTDNLTETGTFIAYDGSTIEW
ncbi:SDR family NAD(P)-dependent oxidoreductase [Aliirhizobium smilacinae]|uniref:SDR family NAD(P)-dependent oxidoreductase n=1 Tax=Aliirhizobium smilacinae TaxID=1395944 RepID=A0A5C4XDJ9_9HYPH|nr:SDR family NAD(P)-dependent oxidoreductase [Rhizobium smilacinae]TNM61555.1 SDR family NAD(P)-dependent oxidoreductase [Rhizobium smilacinae]